MKQEPDSERWGNGVIHDDFSALIQSEKIIGQNRSDRAYIGESD